MGLHTGMALMDQSFSPLNTPTLLYPPVHSMIHCEWAAVGQTLTIKDIIVYKGDTQSDTLCMCKVRCSEL